MSQTGQLISVLVILTLGIFWLWMYRDMSMNPDLTRREKDNWSLAFLFGNVFVAILYYVYVYRNRH